MLKQNNKEILIRLIEEVWNKGNFDVVDELVSPQYIIKHDPGDPWESQTIDLTTFKKRVGLSRNIFPDQKFDLEDMVCENDKVSISWKLTGTQLGDTPGLPATNKPINVSGLTIYYFSEGKITGHWQVFDRLTLLTQLGVKIGQS